VCVVGRQGPAAALYLEQMAGFRDWPAEAVCGLCGRSLGRYIAGRRESDGQVILAESGSFTRSDRPGGNRGLVRGPRTQAGLSIEEFAGRGYIRIRCGCGRNEKLSLGKLGRLAVTIRRDGSLLVTL